MLPLSCTAEGLWGEGVNDVKATDDLTGHAEIRALQAAARELGTRRLTGCVLYTSCEPCPMCLGAIGITEVYYGLSIAGQAEFDDMPQRHYAEFRRAAQERSVLAMQVGAEGGRSTTSFLRRVIEGWSVLHQWIFSCYMPPSSSTMRCSA